MKIIDKLKAWYYGHVQKTIASVLTALATVDLASSVSGYQADITSFLGAKWYAALRVAGGAIMLWRAIQASRKNPVILPPSVVPPAS